MFKKDISYVFSFLAVFFVLPLATRANLNDTEPQIVSRTEWGAIPPRHTPTKLDPLPPKYVIISHTASGICLTKDKCINHVRNIQTMHVKQFGWDDIAYNFLVGGDGLVYEGRGWDIVGAHTYNYNKKSIGIAFIGDFNSKYPTEIQINATKELLAYGLEKKKLENEYKLVGQRQLKATESPGHKLYEIIKTWDHWTSNP